MNSLTRTLAEKFFTQNELLMSRKQRILVTGGAGYIGSHVTLELLKNSYEVIVVDDLSTSLKSTLDNISRLANQPIFFEHLDIRNKSNLTDVFKEYQPNAVIHLAGLKSVSESELKPVSYYDVNVAGTINLLAAMDTIACNKIIFSSSATVYGNVNRSPISESAPTHPISTYGHTKLISENLIRAWQLGDSCRRGLSLRYFNPLGSHESALIGENLRNLPDNVLPRILQTLINEEIFEIYGSDYDTLDGTGVRDYIHVCDLATAHVKALLDLDKFIDDPVLNVGCGKGTSVKELITAVEQVTSRTVRYKLGPNRVGDVDTCYADNTRILENTDWKPRRDILSMCLDAWRYTLHWHKYERH